MKSADINLRLVELANGLIATIDQDAVRAIVDETSTLLGASHWVFASIAPETSPIESYRFLVGCPAEWCQIYERNHWYLTDPVMQYALRSTTPNFVSELPVRTAGQRRMLEEAKEFGFAEGMVIPAHAANNIRVGALYLSYAAAGTMPRELLEAARSALRALAATLLDWDIACLRSEFLNETRLTQREIWMLDYELSGFTAQDIARFEGVSVNSINRSFGSIINKMGVANKHEAAQLALASGLVSQAMGA
jgi:DNA-binding CsgD family transcriptional regulator